jgi:hypothetical protein
MAQTLYASFSDISLAEKAAGALLDYGVRQEDISLVANGERSDGQTVPMASSPGQAYGGSGVAGTGMGTVTAGDPTIISSASGAAYPAGTAPLTDVSPVDTTDDAAAHPQEHAASSLENAAKHGITTTTAYDAEAGAFKGAGVGLVLGAIAAFAVPGIGWALGGGALAAALGATALATGAGAIAGGVVGYLKDQGVPHEAAQHYHDTVQEGGALLTLHLTNDKVSQHTAEEIILKYRGSEVKAY